MSPEPGLTNASLKRFLLARVYLSEGLQAERKYAAGAIARLFSWFIEDPSRLPASHAERIGEFPVHRVVCDYIAGMTDGFFRRTERRLFPQT